MEQYLLTNHSVRYGNIENVCTKLERMVKDGCKTLLIVVDFDFTITRSTCPDGSPGLVSDAIFDKEINTRDVRDSQTLKDLYSKYSPLEHDLLLSSDEKAPFMELWWSNVHEIIAKYGFTMENVTNLVDKAENLQLRSGAVDFFVTAENSLIPVVVYSAGIGNVISSVFEKYLHKLPSNVHIISNWMDINSEGIIVGFKHPLIHCFNKSSKVIPPMAPFLNEVCGKVNVLLLGDNLGDARLDDGLVDVSENVLKIGFYNRKDEKLLSKFTDVYDIVLVDDQTFDVANEIIGKICQS